MKRFFCLLLALCLTLCYGEKTCTLDLQAGQTLHLNGNLEPVS